MPNGDGIHVTLAAVKELNDSLNAAYTKFCNSFSNLDAAMKRLFATGFTGTAAEVFRNKYDNSVQPALAEIQNTTQETNEYTEWQVNATNKYMNDMSDIAGD